MEWEELNNYQFLWPPPHLVTTVAWLSSLCKFNEGSAVKEFMLWELILEYTYQPPTKRFTSTTQGRSKLFQGGVAKVYIPHVLSMGSGGMHPQENFATLDDFWGHFRHHISQLCSTILSKQNFNSCYTYSLWGSDRRLRLTYSVHSSCIGRHAPVAKNLLRDCFLHR